MTQEMIQVYKDHNNLAVMETTPAHSYALMDQSGTDTIWVGNELKFQNGPLKENAPNGWQNEHLVAAMINRLAQLNNKFPCNENDNALYHLKMALFWLEERTKDRVARNVEGQNIK